MPWHRGVGFLTSLKANMDSAPRDATLVHNMQRLLEELDQGIFALEQEPCGPEEPSIFDGKTVSDGDDESYDCGFLLGSKAYCTAEVKHEQFLAWGGHSQGAPNVT